MLIDSKKEDGGNIPDFFVLASVEPETLPFLFLLSIDLPSQASSDDSELSPPATSDGVVQVIQVTVTSYRK